MSNTTHDGSQRPLHTPEPWRVIRADDPDAYLLYGDTGDCIAEMPNPDRQGVEHSNPYRIVECVNACAGMDDPAAEIEKLKQLSYLYAQAVLTAGELRDQNTALRANQQVLADALENLLEDLEEYLPDLSRKEKFALVGVAREALNKIKEGE